MLGSDVQCPCTKNEFDLPPAWHGMAWPAAAVISSVEGSRNNGSGGCMHGRREANFRVPGVSVASLPNSGSGVDLIMATFVSGTGKSASRGAELVAHLPSGAKSPTVVS